FAVAFVGSWLLCLRDVPRPGAPESAPNAVYNRLPRLAFLLVYIGAAAMWRRLSSAWSPWEIDLSFFALVLAGCLSLAEVLRRLPDEWYPAVYQGLPRGVFLLTLSYYFYAAWNWRSLPLIFGSSTVDFFLARAIAREERPGLRRVMLALTVALNLG